MNCSICCFQLTDPGVDVATTPCGHVFHLNCVSRWISTSHSCPSCRTFLSVDQLIKIYLPEATDDVLQQKNKMIRSLRKEKCMLMKRIRFVNEFSYLLMKCLCSNGYLSLGSSSRYIRKRK